MANTEGMSDEAVASLLSPSSSSPSPSSTTNNKKKKSAFAQRQEKMRQRMDGPMAGGRPAATVIRPSPPTQRLSTDYHTRTPDSSAEQNASSCYDERKNEKGQGHQPPPVLGAVLERNVNSNHASNRDTKGIPKSHFSQQKLRNQGFPSVHAPLGTFVVKNAKKHEAESLAQVQPQTPLSTSVSSSRHGETNDSIAQTSQAMLAQMTSDEIHGNVQELKEALTPETIAFLQKRGRQKTLQAPTTTAKPAPSTTIMTATTTISSDKVIEAEEKQRVASLLSSVKTPDELDHVYAQEIAVKDESGNDVEPEQNDFATACNLLRSTSSRQVLWAARIVCQQLQDDVSAGKSFPVDQNKDWPYPTVLAVSLRCLLDNSVSQSNGVLLHTYVLQSLYALLKLRAHSDHVVDVSGHLQTGTSIYQEFFLDDTVPSPPFGSCYPTMVVHPVAGLSSETDEGGCDAVAYATDSSSTSAIQDGQAFAKDPMWTLLTRMRVLPRLAQLLSASSSHLLTDEALVAVCGVLSMLALRSAGTASAIAQHPTILQSLLSIAVLPPTCDKYPGFLNKRVALPAMLFLCTLARQSRVAASAIPVDSILPPILALSIETDEQFRLQQWSLILWRSTLRYGLGFSSLSTLISLSITHLASERPSKHSLAPELLSAFSNVCYCVRVAKSKPANDWIRFIPLEVSEILNNALYWLSSTARQTVQHIMNSDGSDESDILIAAARLKFLRTYVSAVEQGGFHDDIQRRHEDGGIGLHDTIGALRHVSESKVFQNALTLIPKGGCDQAALDKDDGWVDVASSQLEATASAYIGALTSLLYALSVPTMRPFSDDHDHEVLVSVLATFGAAFLDWMKSPFPHAFAGPELPRPRRGWINATISYMIRFVLTNSLSPKPSNSEMESVRARAFRLIGRLQLGEEALAAMLFSKDVLFQAADEAPSITSPLSSFFMQELCATSVSRQQLDHSFKLHGGFGITPKEWGPFTVDTLLSESDVCDVRISSPFSERLLPMGPFWLWKILSGTMIQQSQDENRGASDETGIIVACLELLLIVEERCLSIMSSTAAENPDGAKLYYLMNVFLQPERVIRDDRISDLVASLFDLYTAELLKKESSRGAPIAESFWRACFDHSRIGHDAKPTTTDSRDEKLFSVLMGRNDKAMAELRPLIDFAVDIARAYLEFGAQYEVFAKCVRVLLSVVFPSQVRCEALRSLRDVLHLLTLSKEGSIPVGPEMMDALKLCLYGGVFGSNEAVRDSSEFLDLIVSVMRQDTSHRIAVPKWSAVSGGFFYLFAIASLVRSLVASIKDGVGEVAMKTRLELLSKETRDIVYESASRMQADSDESVQDFVRTVANVVMEYR